MPRNPSEKQLNLIAFVATQLGREAGFLKLFKTLYLADKEHLANYGRTITGDRYIAMERGPVPSAIYDILKIARGDRGDTALREYYEKFFSVYGQYQIAPSASIDEDYFSESEVECLNDALIHCSEKNIDELSRESHQEAWKTTPRNWEIDLLKIATEGGATPEMIDFIVDDVAVEKIFL